MLTKAKRLAERIEHELTTCRECGGLTSPTAWICEHCGTGNPVKIGVSPQLLLTAIACEVVLVLLSLSLF